ncbi:MAG: GatB/YqeY domain-containing protein [candidate division Zixibacteria bacterium]|nr:GatB/YqeY domain-containing protein [candidate division Zixibacteria bacterium]
MSIIEKLETELIKALKSGEKEKVVVLRGLKSDIKYKKIDKGEELTNEEVIDVLSLNTKKIRDSIEQFGKGGREDLVIKEKAALKIISEYLPEQIGEEELRGIVKQAVEESGAESPQQMGLVMKIVMPKIKGRADGKLVSKLAVEFLAK